MFWKLNAYFILYGYPAPKDFTNFINLGHNPYTFSYLLLLSDYSHFSIYFFPDNGTKNQL